MKKETSPVPYYLLYTAISQKFFRLKRCVTLLLLLAAGCVQRVHAQLETGPGNYTYGKRRLTFEDNFEDNRNDWLGKTDAAPQFRIANGMLQIDAGNLPEQQEIRRIGVDIKKEIDYTRDFEIELSFRMHNPGGRHKEVGSFYWGSSDSLGSTWLSLKPGCMVLTYCHGGDHKHEQHKHLYLHPKLKQDSSAKVTVRKVKDKYYFFIDERFIKEKPYEPLPYVGLAFAARRPFKVSYDYIRVSYLD